jgi:DNA polymerase III delta subunit
LDVIVSDIRRGQFKPVYLLYGEESFLRDHRARELAEAVVDKELEDFNCTEFRASETDAATIGSAIMAAPVLSALLSLRIRLLSCIIATTSCLRV